MDLEYKFKKQTGGRGKFAVINMKYKPLTPEQVEEKVTEIEELKDPKIKPDPNNVYFVNAIIAGVDPEGVHPERGGRLPRGGEEGVQVPVPVRGPGVRPALRQVPRRGLVAGRVLPVRAWKRFRDAETQAGITAARADHEGGGGLARSSTRGRSPATSTAAAGIIEETSEDKGVAQVMAKIPLANLFGYTSDLRSATSGTASFRMEFSHYAPVPRGTGRPAEEGREEEVS